jgi:hypothetical protein
VPQIQLNPQLWPDRQASIDGELYGHGDLIDVTDEQWTGGQHPLKGRWSKQLGNSYRTWIVVGSDIPASAPNWVRAENLADLSYDQLKQLASDRELPRSGTKADLVERIKEYEEALAAPADETL